MLKKKKKPVKLQDADTGHRQTFGLASTTILTVQQCEELAMMNKTGQCNKFHGKFYSLKTGMATVIHAIHYSGFKKTGSCLSYQSACLDTVK